VELNVRTVLVIGSVSGPVLKVADTTDPEEKQAGSYVKSPVGYENEVYPFS
jgi:hypothetical protein